MSSAVEECWVVIFAGRQRRANPAVIPETLESQWSSGRGPSRLGCPGSGGLVALAASGLCSLLGFVLGVMGEAKHSWSCSC